MKVKCLITIFSIIHIIPCYAQDYELVTIHPPQTFYLDPGIESGSNRTSLLFETPYSAIELYYAFTTKSIDGNASLNLYSQLNQAVDEWGISSEAYSTIKIPEGETRCNVFVVEGDEVSLFEEGEKPDYDKGSSRTHFTHGLVKITDVAYPTGYLGFENLNPEKGIFITVEIVALNDNTIQPSKAEEVLNTTAEVAELADEVFSLFGEIGKEKREKKKKQDEFTNLMNTGWVMYESGDFESALHYSTKALEIMEQPSLYFNLGLIQWCSDSSRTSTDYYLDGLKLIYQCETKEEAIGILETGLKDISDAQEKHGYVSKAPPVGRLLSMKLEEVQLKEKW
ncbi:MAG: hypothetical protein RLP14_10330 [Owenweeksia sp.]